MEHERLTNITYDLDLKNQNTYLFYLESKNYNTFLSSPLVTNRKLNKVAMKINQIPS